MPRLLRIYLLACITLAFAYLLLHAREPLRLNVGDPWSDASTLTSIENIKQHGFTTDAIDLDPLIAKAHRPTHLPPLAEMLYGALGLLGADDIGTLRLFALAWSGLAIWLLFAYARRIWGDPVALLATALFTTSVLWMMYADSIHRPPAMHALCFLALWGLVRAIETQEPRHYAAAFIGSFLCLFAGFGDWLFLAAAVLFTVYMRLGNPLANGHRRFVLICAAGALVGLAARSLLGIGPVEWQPGVLEWQASVDGKLAAPLATAVRRYTLLFTPMFWVTLVYTAWRALRAPSLRALLDDGMTWMAAIAAVFLYFVSQPTASPMLRAQPLLPFYAVGSAILIARLLDRGGIRRGLAIAWIAIAPAWAFYVLLSHPRSVLDREDVAKVRSYLAANDRNDFVMSNLLSNGPIQAAFDRHSWPAPEVEAVEKRTMLLSMLDMFESTGTDYFHAVIFTTPESRFVDRSLGQLLVYRRLASVTGWPHLFRRKADEIIRAYDRRVKKNLKMVGATRVLQLHNFDVHRVERKTVLELLGQTIPVVSKIDFSSLGSDKHKLLGWGQPQLTAEEQLGVSSIAGHLTCQNPVVEPRAGELAFHACDTVLTSSGLHVVDRRFVERAQLMIRVERACDLRLTLELASPPLVVLLPLEITTPPLVGLSINDFTTWQCVPAKQVSFVVPARSVHTGINLITFEKKGFASIEPRADVLSLAIEPLCNGAIEEAAH